MVRSSMVNGMRVSQKGSELKYGQMVVVTKVNGYRENRLVKVLKLTKMGRPSVVSGKEVFSLF
jgi:hypothetical protein